MNWGRVTLILVAGVVFGFIGGWWAGGPRVVVRSFSPDGQRVAEVRSRFALDPPAHSLWVQAEGKRGAEKVEDLGEDVDWCNSIVWSPDSQRVAFLVRGLRLVVYTFSTGRVSRVSLIEGDGYPGDFEARQVAFGEGGRTISYFACKRGSDRCDGGKIVSLEEG